VAILVTTISLFHSCLLGRDAVLLFRGTLKECSAFTCRVMQSQFLNLALEDEGSTFLCNMKTVNPV